MPIFIVCFRSRPGISGLPRDDIQVAITTVVGRALLHHASVSGIRQSGVYHLCWTLSLLVICIGWTKNHSTKTKFDRLTQTFSEQEDLIVLVIFTNCQIEWQQAKRYWDCSSRITSISKGAQLERLQVSPCEIIKELSNLSYRLPAIYLRVICVMRPLCFVPLQHSPY
jgi:hypothetical protein